MRLKSSLTSLMMLASPALLFIAAPASAAVIRVSATGAVDNLSGSRGVTTTLTRGSPLDISFNFDTSQPFNPVFSDADNIRYRVSISDASANIGGHIFQFDSSSSFLTISRGFTFFGNPFSEAALIQQFFFRGFGGNSVPFTLPNGVTFDTISITSFFNFGMSAVPNPSIALLRDPGSAARNLFDYSASNNSRPFEFGQASASNPIIRFTPVSVAVPEPATWSMLIIGFGLVGGAMRRRARNLASA